MARYRLYWQPGCTSCLRAKEFLASHNIEFDSINVRADPGAIAELASHGIRAVPVIERDGQYVLGQDLEELAAFLGVPWTARRLEAGDLLGRLHRLLQVAAAQVRALPADSWGNHIPQRERTYLDLGYHIGMIVEGFLEAAQGGELRFEFYERRVPPDRHDALTVATFLDAVRARLAEWSARDAADPPRTLRTYFGTRSLHVVLERTAWHVAQHCRQLEHLLLERLHAEPSERLAAADLDGLPLPQGVWDREISGL